METANCLDWQRGHKKWSGPGHPDKGVGFTNLSDIIYYIVISLFYDCEEMLCSCLGVCLVIVYCLVFVSTPVSKNGAGCHMFIVVSSLVSQVLSGMCRYVDLLFDC